VDDADISYINERNKKFNEKCERFYGKYTEEIRGNLERGTALWDTCFTETRVARARFETRAVLRCAPHVQLILTSGGGRDAVRRFGMCSDVMVPQGRPVTSRSCCVWRFGVLDDSWSAARCFLTIFIGHWDLLNYYSPIRNYEAWTFLRRYVFQKIRKVSCHFKVTWLLIWIIKVSSWG